MTLGHAFPRRILAVARILRDIRRPHHAGAHERWLKDLSVTRHRKVFKCGSWRTRQRIEHVTAAIRRKDVIEERAKLGAGQFNTSIGYDLDDFPKVALAGDGGARII